MTKIDCCVRKINVSKHPEKYELPCNSNVVCSELPIADDNHVITSTLSPGTSAIVVVAKKCKLKIYKFFMKCSGVSAAALLPTVTLLTKPGADTWTVPGGVTKVTVMCLGAGGYGGHGGNGSDGKFFFDFTAGIIGGGGGGGGGGGSGGRAATLATGTYIIAAGVTTVPYFIGTSSIPYSGSSSTTYFGSGTARIFSEGGLNGANGANGSLPIREKAPVRLIPGKGGKGGASNGGDAGNGGIIYIAATATDEITFVLSNGTNGHLSSKSDEYGGKGGNVIDDITVTSTSIITPILEPIIPGGGGGSGGPGESSSLVFGTDRIKLEASAPAVGGQGALHNPATNKFPANGENGHAGKASVGYGSGGSGGSGGGGGSGDGGKTSLSSLSDSLASHKEPLTSPTPGKGGLGAKGGKGGDGLIILIYDSS